MFSILQMPELDQVAINDKLWNHYTNMVVDANSVSMEHTE